MMDEDSGESGLEYEIPDSALPVFRKRIIGSLLGNGWIGGSICTLVFALVFAFLTACAVAQERWVMVFFSAAIALCFLYFH